MKLEYFETITTRGYSKTGDNDICELVPEVKTIKEYLVCSYKMQLS